MTPRAGGARWRGKAGKDDGRRASVRGSRLVTNSTPEQGTDVMRLSFLTWIRGITTTTISNTVLCETHMKHAARRLRAPKKHQWRDFPGGAVVQNPPANAGVMGLIPGLGRSHSLQGS